jgi:hypothetical protein
LIWVPTRQPARRRGFANGAEVTLQALGVGVKGYVYNALSSPVWMPETAEAF